MSFPMVRMRRTRRNETLRRLVAETTLSVSDLIYPMFVCSGKGVRQPVGSMPGIDRFSIDMLVEECKAVRDLGIPAVILFGIPDKKDPMGRGAYDKNGIVPQALKALRKQVPGLVLMADVCICEYTDHGHCGLIDGNTVHNDATLDLLAKAAVVYAQAGAHVVAPSDMMDGRVGEIRDALDEAELPDTIVMSYAAKYCSAFYGPFREAADSAPQFGDRKTYQMDPANVREALREVALDIDEGADIVMVKPALPYLDIIAHVRDEFDLPVAAYNVSGEYSMVKAAAANGWIDHDRVVLETLLSIKRAGADMILTYHAMEAAKLLGGK